MSFFSASFFLFLAVTLLVYAVIPQRLRWLPLLAASCVFYCFAGLEAFLYLVGTTLTVWGGARIMTGITEREKELRAVHPEWTPEAKKLSRKQAKEKRRVVFWLVLALNIGVLCVVKYTNFVGTNLTAVANLFAAQKTEFSPVSLLVPLGISFYTFQAVGYLIDVYNGKYAAEKHLGRFSLFVSFFPQITQGPIGRYDQLGEQFKALPALSLSSLEDGALRMLWGYFKKMVIADRLAPLISTVFASTESYSGSVIFVAVLAYALQLYADFSGGIDIVSGVAELFGIKLAPNFKRPYFATSLADFWRRWHISLGAWMRDYVFYPFALTRGVSRLGKRLKGHCSDSFVRALPAALGNLVVFFVVGVWHGAQWSFIAWGLYNGAILAISSFLEPTYQRFAEKHPKLDASFAFKVFRILRTFLLVVIGYYFDCALSARGAISLMGKSLLHPGFAQLNSTTLTGLLGGVEPVATFLWVLGVATAVLFTVSVMQEKGICVRQWLFARPLAVRWLILLAFIFLALTFMVTGSDAMEGFMYAIY